MSKNPVIDPDRAEEKLVRFIRSEFKKRGFRKAVFGLSGGVDSSLVAFLLKKALGARNVVAVFLPYRTTDKASRRDFKEVVRISGIRSKVIPITPMVDCYFRRFPKGDRIRRGNKMARERMSILYDRSKAEDALVVGSGNRTEILLGYATLYGDTACAVNPIGGLYKTQVRQLATHMGVPDRIVAKAPTADLWPGQSDEDELGLSYAAVDEILHLAVDRKYTPGRLARKGFGKATVKRIMNRVEEFKYKRELPAIARL